MFDQNVLQPYERRLQQFQQGDAGLKFREPHDEPQLERQLFPFDVYLPSQVYQHLQRVQKFLPTEPQADAVNHRLQAFELREPFPRPAVGRMRQDYVPEYPL